MPTDSDYHMRFRSDLQGLRALAVILVILSHAGASWFEGGFIGVDVFFVLSGFFITGLLLRELDTTGQLNLLKFYTRRFKRLLPNLFLMLIVSVLAANMLLSDFEVGSQLASLPFAASWTSNIYFALISVNYFEELANRDLFLHTWSLGVEEQFYLIWPLLLWLLYLQLAKLKIAVIDYGKIVKNTLLIIIFSSLLAMIFISFYEPQSAFYMMPTRIWQLAVGGLIYVLQDEYKITEANEHPNNILLFLKFGFGLLLVICSGLFFTPAHGGLWLLLPVIGTALIILCGRILLLHKLNNPLSNKLLSWIGDRSYALYLWHWPVLMLGFSLGWQSLFEIILLLIITSLLAIFSYRFIELPFWKGRFSKAKTYKALPVSLAMMLAGVIGSVQVLAYFPRANSIDDISLQWRSDSPEIYEMGCDAWFDNAVVQPCFFTETGYEKTVVLIGDSVGAQWFSLLPEIFPTPQWRSIVFTKSSCPIVDEDLYYERIGRIYEVCNEWRDEVLATLDNFEPELVIIGSAATYDFNQTQWIEGSSRIFQRLSNIAEQSFIIPGTPNLGFDGPGCLARGLASDEEIGVDNCQAENRTQQTDIVTNYLSEAASRFENVHMLDLNELVCPQSICSARSPDGVVVFRDSQHLTDTFVRTRSTQVNQLMFQLETELL